MNIGEVHSVEIVGGSVRIPKVQSVLKETFGLADLSKTLNGVNLFFSLPLFFSILTWRYHRTKLRFLDLYFMQLN